MRVRSTAAASVLIGAALSFGFTGTANAADLDCSDFASQAQAQAAYDATPGDPNRLDQDGDGIACETLPGAAGTQSVSEDSTVLGASQVSNRPAGSVAAGDGSAAEGGSVLPYVLGGLAFAGAGGAAVAARRSSRTAA
ncbi:excalibur calcium-binding domain-containing protein [Modestobacter versicolor]|uniref:excalibur calcium-binding domain-containing protein n=1 Tax=Modestobacter versicolor TaxID=429133 RepID=UPI0034DFF260